MKFYVRNWYWFGLVAAAVAAVVLVVCWSDMGMLQRLLVLNFIALAVHQAEEYGWPGGEPMVMNYALMGSDMPDRFPLNQFSGMVTNVVAMVLVYLVPCFFPSCIWLGLPGILFGIGQFFVHGVMTNVRMRSWYNPGLFAVTFMHVPIGVCYLWYVGSNGLATGWDWLWGVLLTMVAAGLLVGWSTYVIFATKRTNWPFDAKELARFDVVAKMERKGITPETDGEKGLYYQTPLAKIQRKLHPKG